MERRRVLTAAYAVVLTGVTILGWVPALADADGRLFGTFRLIWYNDALLYRRALLPGACWSTTTRYVRRRWTGAAARPRGRSISSRPSSARCMVALASTCSNVGSCLQRDH